MNAARPLDGICVLDLGQIYAGPYAAFLMAMAGATVIKIESPGKGESLRARGKEGGKEYLPFVMLNRNKLGLSINLKSPRGRELLMELVRRADILVENFGPGVLDRLGCGWEATHAENPRLIYASCTGYGLTGPKRNLPAVDLTVQAMSGVINATGFSDQPPVKAGPAISDFAAGVHLFAGVMTALYERTRTGLGRRVEVSMLEATLPTLSSNLAAWYSSSGALPPRTGNRHSTLSEAPCNVYPSKDGYIALICYTEDHWRSFCNIVSRPELATDPRFCDRLARAANIDELDRIVAAWTSTRTRAEACAQLDGHGVVCAPVRGLDEVVHDEHLLERGSLRWEKHRALGDIVVADSPIRFSETEPMAFVTSPMVGEHNEQVICGMLGRSQVELSALRNDGVI